MAKFTTFADVLTSDSISWAAYTSGVKKNVPGVPLKEILEHNGGVYVNRLEMRDAFREQLRTAGRLPGNEELLEIAERPTIDISLEHLRDVGPSTRIIVGYGIEYTDEEGEQLGLSSKMALDPKDTVEVDVDPAHPWRVKRG
jgi:hypothetical protein